MTEYKELRPLEATLAEKTYARLRTQALVFYLVSLAVALGIGASLVWQYKVLAELSDERISEYRLLVAEKLDYLHQLDLEEVLRRTRPQADCQEPLPRSDAEKLLRAKLGRAPEGSEIHLLLEKAAGFGVCDVGQILHIYEDAESMARVDTLYRVLLRRRADPIGRFIYGYWLASGVEVEAVARDIMASPEFQKLRKLGGK